MRIVTLTRLDTSDEGTFGRLTCDGMAAKFTLELPWRDNARSVSCIPVGTYRGLWTFSPRFRRRMYLVAGAEPRLGIRIHPANWAGDVAKGFKSQLNGCIALGKKLGWLAGQKAVLVSRPAVRDFETFMQGEPFTLEIIDGTDKT